MKDQFKGEEETATDQFDFDEESENENWTEMDSDEEEAFKDAKSKNVKVKRSKKKVVRFEGRSPGLHIDIGEAAGVSQNMEGKVTSKSPPVPSDSVQVTPRD
jgi:hypothetical protein